jgi:hypothetical protein
MYGSRVTDHRGVRQATAERLAAWELEVPDVLPLLGEDDVAWVRPVDQVVARCHALAAVIGLAQGADPDDVAAALIDHDLARWLDDRERYLLDARTGAASVADPARLRQAEIDATWRQEALWALLWALGFVDDLPPDEECGDSRPYERMTPDMDPANTVDGITLRPVEVLVPMLDFYYVLHWHEREAQFGGAGLPKAIQPGVIRERRTALEWLFHDVRWGDVDTST